MAIKAVSRRRSLEFLLLLLLLNTKYKQEKTFKKYVYNKKKTRLKRVKSEEGEKMRGTNTSGPLLFVKGVVGSHHNESIHFFFESRGTNVKCMKDMRSLQISH